MNEKNFLLILLGMIIVSTNLFSMNAILGLIISVIEGVGVYFAYKNRTKIIDVVKKYMKGAKDSVTNNTDETE